MAQIQHEQGQHCQTPNFGPGGAGSSKNLLGTWSKFLSLPFSQPHIEVCGFQKEKVLVPLNYIGTRRDSKWTSLFRTISMNTRNLGRYWEDFFQWTYCLYNPPPKKKNSPSSNCKKLLRLERLLVAFGSVVFAVSHLYRSWAKGKWSFLQAKRRRDVFQGFFVCLGMHFTSTKIVLKVSALTVFGGI